MSDQCAVIASSLSPTITSYSYFNVSTTTTAAFVTRTGSSLFLNGASFYAAGANIYWLGLDENVQPNPSYPTEGRILEIFATAAAMGATAVRVTTLGVSVGCELCVHPSLGMFNTVALEAIDLAIYVASLYGLIFMHFFSRSSGKLLVKLIIPLVDQPSTISIALIILRLLSLTAYLSYHGGIPTFLAFRNLSISDHQPFYNLSSPVFTDFTTYVETILNHTSSITNIALKHDPTIMAWETGNELADPPVQWTTAISQQIKALAPNHLVINGAYGIQNDALSIDSIDIHSNHFYPLDNNRMQSDAKLVSNAGRVYLIGEYDWTDRYSRLPLVFGFIPVILAVICLFLPKRWFGQEIRVPFRRKPEGATLPKHTSTSSADYTLDNSSIPLESFEDDKLDPESVELKKLLKDPVEKKWYFRKWHLSLLFLLLVPVVEGIVLSLGPTYLTEFLMTSAKTTGVGGDLFWSLFGRDNNCCQFVEHDDGYTLYYDSTNTHTERQVQTITNHAYLRTNRQPSYASVPIGNSQLLPQISCPQASATVNASSTIVTAKT